jgi:hypothetical protein
MRDQDDFGGGRVAPQRAGQQRLMLLRRKLAAEHHRDHLVAQVAVVDAAMDVEQRAGAAGGDQRVMELAVVALPGFRVAAIAGEHPPFHAGQLVMRADHAAFPLHVAGREREVERVAFKQHAHRGDLPHVRRRDRRDLEAALPLCLDEPFRCQAAQQLAQGRDAGPIVLAQTLEA